MAQSCFAPLRAALLFLGTVGPALAQTAASGPITAAAAGQEIAVPSFSIQRFVIEGNSLLDSAAADALVAPFAGPGRDFGDVQRAIEALEAAYRTRGYSAVGVFLPEQVLDSGVVRLRVVEAKIKRVTVGGNTHFDTSNIRASVPALVEGSVPDLDRLSAALRVANENPAKNVSLQLAPGSGDDELVATVKVNDQKPWKVGVSWDNSGTQQTGDDRVGVSLQHANLWNRDHVLTLQYQTSPRDTSNVRVAAATYRVPLYARGDAIDFYASSSDVDAGTIAAGPFNLAITGKGESYGARYSFKLKRQGETDHELVFGLDYKRFQNGIGFGGIDLGNEVVTHPLSAQYSRRSNRAGEEMALSLTLVRNIPGGDKGDQAAISKTRQDAEADYVLLRGALSYSRALPQDWQARLALSAQAADKPLIAGEQFGAGGVTSVRGFNERELSNDRGFQGSAELYSPPLCGGFASQQCRLLAFFDWASLSRLKPLPGEIGHENISGAGIGLRWSLGTTANLQMDYGRVIDDGGLSKSGDWKLHARVGVFF